MKTKIDLWDVTFNIILRLDSIERLENIIASITFLNRHFIQMLQFGNVLIGIMAF